MILASNSNTNVLENFLAMSSWQSFVAILIFISVEIGFWFVLKKYKIKFMYRIISGLIVGLIFGIIVQSIIGFPQKEAFEGYKNVDVKNHWVYQLSIWVEFFKRIFINGVTLLMIPVVFIAMFKITATQKNNNVTRITLKGAAMLLINVAFAFTVTFFLGYFFNVGQVDGQSLTDDGTTNDRYNSVALPNLISGFMPSNFFSTLAGTSVIPVMILGALAGGSVRILSKRKSVEMDAIRKSMTTGWDITMSILMTFMKLMPLAVMSMITYSIITRPIGQLAIIGKVIGVGYLGIFIAIAWVTLLIFLSGIKTSKWWKFAWRPLLSGFSTQSSNATLPTTMDTLKNDFKVSETVAGILGPLSTYMGLIACAGIQSGLALSILWTGTGSDSVVHQMGFIQFFFLGMLVTVISSLGIAGIPGTATVVTVGVVGGLGFGAFTQSVLNIIAPLDGLFDMGRTGANVLAGVGVATIVARTEGQIEDGSPLLTQVGIIKQKRLLTLNQQKTEKEELLKVKDKQLSTLIFAKEISREQKQEQKKVLQNEIDLIKSNYKKNVSETKEKFQKMLLEQKSSNIKN
ncbi:proton/glutamate symporter [Spiroplasma helicoides]|uniref:L-cystine uptake protein TcyP n=1 Tax=Spiroplasma helicoides TaxID=216938 RepID=A0A1B3SJZ1_9MOLU|nr:cation:dicarboxylase symporter family transporter [Spiroplasma helicoides]AOG60238.1 proton/glutamate symporter [Spiroplasma helicoides]